MARPSPTPLPFGAQVTLTLQKAGLLEDRFLVEAAGAAQAFIVEQIHPGYSDAERAALAGLGQHLLLRTPWPVQMYDTGACRVLWVARDPTVLGTTL